MSSDVIAYQVDKSKIEAAWGCQDPNLANRLLIKYESDIGDYLDEIDVSSDVFQAHLNDMIAGRMSESEEQFLYSYIYELLCQEYGELLETESFMCYLEEATSCRMKTFFPVPEDEDSGWEIYSVTYEELESARAMFLNNPEDYAQEDYYVDEINTIFDTACENKKALVFLGY